MPTIDRVSGLNEHNPQVLCIRIEKLLNADNESVGQISSGSNPER